MSKEEIIAWIKSTTVENLDDLTAINKAVFHQHKKLDALKLKEFQVGDLVKIGFRGGDEPGRVDKVMRTNLIVNRTTDGSIFFGSYKVKPFHITKINKAEFEKMVNSA